MNREARGIVIGMAIGDGHIEAQKHQRADGKSPATLTVRHAAKQADYARHKAALLGQCLGVDPIKVREFDNSGYPGVTFYKSHRYFRILRKWLYPNGKKVISNLLPYLTVHGLAIWYMDDGSLTIAKTKGRPHCRRIYLNTYTDQAEAEKTASFLNEKWGFRFRLHKHKGLYRLLTGSEGSQKFVEVVKPFIIPSMQYKVDMKYVRGPYQFKAPSTPQITA